MRAFVTGVSPGGIGGAICRRIAADSVERGEKARIAACASAAGPELDALERELREAGAAVLTLTGDLGHPAAPAALFSEGLAFLGGLDALVYGAGVVAPAPLLECTVADWDRAIAVNVRGAFLLARAAYPALKASRGRVVFIGAMEGAAPRAGSGAFSSSKAAQHMMARTLSDEWAGDGIVVNTVAPGPTGRDDRADDTDPALERARAVLPLGKIGRPAEIAGVVSYLLGPDGGYTTGQTITADGGLHRGAAGRILTGDAGLCPAGERA